LTVFELKNYLNIPRDAAYALVNANFRPAIKVGRSWQIDESALKRWIKNQIRKKDDYYGTKNQGQSPC